MIIITIIITVLLLFMLVKIKLTLSQNSTGTLYKKQNLESDTTSLQL